MSPSAQTGGGLRPARWLDASHDPAARSLQQLFRAPARPDSISFGGGLPAPELFPTDAFERAFARAVREDGVRSLQYGPTDGVPALREAVAERLARRGIQVERSNVLITTGSQQGLHLAGRVMLDPGDTIATEAPAFMGAFRAWESQRPRYVPIPVDDDGMQVEALAEALEGAAPGEMPKLVYALPTFQNPSGVTLSLERRQRLLDLARQYDLLVVEDDPYGDLWFDEAAPRVPPIRALPGAEEHVLYLGTFSKILAPGLRVGYAVAPPGLAERFVRAKLGVDVHTDGVSQHVVAALCRDTVFDLDAHITDLRRAYRERRDAMLDALEMALPGSVHWTRPLGGFFLWLRLSPEIDAVRLAEAAAEEGVGYVPGSLFYPGQGGQDALRLAYSQTSPERIGEGVRRLGRALERASG